VAISAGGNSPNVVRAAELARTRGARVVALVGFSGGRLLKLADAAVHVRGSDYGPIEDAHLAIGHMFTDAIRRRIGDMS
jgi:D-sedoheptulose 7-phosphate isomerase